MDAKFIKVNKILDRDESNTSGEFSCEVEVIRISDIRGVRNFKKHKKYTNIDGDICQLSIDSVSGTNGFYTIRIQESEPDFMKRLGTDKTILLNAERDSK